MKFEYVYLVSNDHGEIEAATLTEIEALYVMWDLVLSKNDPQYLLNEYEYGYLGDDELNFEISLDKMREDFIQGVFGWELEGYSLNQYLLSNELGLY